MDNPDNPLCSRQNFPDHCQTTAHAVAESVMSFSELSTTNRRNLKLLISAQALGGSSAPIVISLGGLIGQQLTPEPALATLPVSLYGVGVALSMLPVALLMRRYSRRLTYVLGALVCIVAASLSASAIIQQSFWLFCLGLGLAGFYGACVQNYRFAASDLVPDAYKPNAISMIMLGGLAAAVIGPQVAIWFRDSWQGVAFAGSFVGQAVLALLALPLLWSLRIPELQQGDQDASARPLLEIASTPGFIVAVLAATVSYSLMSFIMTAAPISMVHHGHSSGAATLGIQWHILAMFAPSFFTGKLINRFGDRVITTVGIMLLFSSSLIALSGLAVGHFWAALILLGLGWNFGFIGATAMLTHTYRPSEKARVQALNDFLVFGSVALASLEAGHQFNIAGWYQLNLITFPVIAVVLVMLVILPWWQRRQPA